MPARVMNPEPQYADSGMLRVSRGQDTAKIPEHSHPQAKRAVGHLSLRPHSSTHAREQRRYWAVNQKFGTIRIGHSCRQGASSCRELRHRLESGREIESSRRGGVPVSFERTKLKSLNDQTYGWITERNIWTPAALPAAQEHLDL